MTLAGVTRSAQIKPGFIFLHTCQLKGMKFGVVIKQFKWKILILSMIEFMKSRKMNVVLLTAQKKCNVHMHSHIYELIWLKLSMMIDFILVMWPWLWFKRTVIRESNNSCTNHLTNSWMDLDWIRHTVNTCWSDELPTHFMSSYQDSKENI